METCLRLFVIFGSLWTALGLVLNRTLDQDMKEALGAVVATRLGGFSIAQVNVTSDKSQQRVQRFRNEINSFDTNRLARNSEGSVRTIILDGHESGDAVQAMLRREFELDDEPVLFKGAQKYLVPSLMADVFGVLVKNCGDLPNEEIPDLDIAISLIQNHTANIGKNVLDIYLKMTGRDDFEAVYDRMPKSLREFISEIKENNMSEEELQRVRFDEFLYSFLAYVTGRGFKGALNRCSRLEELLQDDPYLFASRAPWNEWDNYPFMFAGLRGFPLEPLHKHTTWVDLRRNASLHGYWRKDVTTVLHGKKTWVVFPGSEDHDLYLDDAWSGKSTINFYNYDAFLPAWIQSARWPNAIRAKHWTATLDVGDILLLPSNNLHQIYNEQDTLGLTLPLQIPKVDVLSL